MDKELWDDPNEEQRRLYLGEQDSGKCSSGFHTGDELTSSARLCSAFRSGLKFWW